jgi:hypothetical protein
MYLRSSQKFPHTLAPRLFAAACLVIWPLLACSSGTEVISPGSVSVRAAQDTAWLVVGSPRTSFELPVIVYNRSTVTIDTDECRIGAQRLIDGAWQTVFTPACLANNAPIALFPGDSVALRFLASATTEPGTTPQLDPRMTVGTYRAIVSLWWIDRNGARVSLPEAKSASSNFVVAIR